MKLNLENFVDTFMNNYLIENGLTDNELNLITKSNIPRDARQINDEPLIWYEAEIVLCSCIKSVQHLDEIEFGVKSAGDNYWNIFVWWKDDRTPYYEEHPRIDPTIRVINMLLPYMAGSNKTYLADSMKSS